MLDLDTEFALDQIIEQIKNSSQSYGPVPPTDPADGYGHIPSPQAVTQATGNAQSNGTSLTWNGKAWYPTQTMPQQTLPLQALPQQTITTQGMIQGGMPHWSWPPNIPVKVEKVAIKTASKDGCSCKTCKEYYPYAEPNQDDGTLICYGCRMDW